MNVLVNWQVPAPVVAKPAAVAAVTVTKPPPPAEVDGDDGGYGDETFDVRSSLAMPCRGVCRVQVLHRVRFVVSLLLASVLGVCLVLNGLIS
jgi:hypothetical protein